MRKKLFTLYRALYKSFGRQRWWPADSAFEVMVGAILTQNTNWANVEKAISKLRRHKLLNAHSLNLLSIRRLANLIRSAGYYNIKAVRLKEFLRFLSEDCSFDINRLSRRNVGTLRRDLLAVKGIGPETADSMLLYALNKPVFVVDAYTKRILSRHSFIDEDASYEGVQNLFMQNLPKDVKLFNEFHALLVRLGKDYCLKNKPRCEICPLRETKSVKRKAQS